MLECRRQDTKEAMICIDNKIALIKFTNFYQNNHNFSYFSTKISHVTGSILNWGSAVVDITHFDAGCNFIILCKNCEINLTQS